MAKEPRGMKKKTVLPRPSRPSRWATMLPKLGFPSQVTDGCIRKIFLRIATVISFSHGDEFH